MRINTLLYITFLTCLPRFSAAEKVSYNRDIQPILSENCFFCHGPDGSSRKPEDAPLRLDLEEFANATREDGPQPFIPGDPDNSYMIKLMESEDPHEVMPLHPSRDPAHGKVMKKEDIALVREWIAQGAKYEPHWAYVSPVKKELPAAGEGWAKNAIDYFIAEKHEELELTPNPQQKTPRLLRRLYFDLIGLPPTPDQLESFIKDERAFNIKYGETVDQLLTTNEHAEHMARQWMDVARYADTQGIHHDFHRTVWPYRDWVIQAFKENMPFDQFTIEQLAGDLLPNATEEQKLATGYLRVLATSGEGGLILEEYEAIYAQDRVDAMSAAWLGLTTGCAACHDHKFDQLSTKEVYELTAFFRNNTMSVMQGADQNVPPYQFAPHPDDDTSYAEIKPRIQAASDAYTKVKNEHMASYNAWNANLLSYNGNPHLSHLFLNDLKQLQLNASGQTLTEPIKGGEVTEKSPGVGTAVSLGKERQYTFPMSLNLSSDKPFSLSFQLKLTDEKARGSLFSQMRPDQKLKGWDVWLENRQIGMHMVNEWPKHAMKGMSQHQLKVNQWYTITINYDGSSQPKGLSIYFDLDKVNTFKHGEATLDRQSISVDAPFTVNGRHNKSELASKVMISNFKHYDHQINEVTILKNTLENNPQHHVPGKVRESVKDYYFSHYNEHTKPFKAAVNKVNYEFSPIKLKGGNSLIYGEKVNADPFAHILIRGQYASKGEKVYPNTPSVLPPIFLEEKGGEKGGGKTVETVSKVVEKPERIPSRLDLAKWLMRADNPLPSRVIVNRYWSYFFGKGFLTNNADFGAMGGHPSHPELIDWLSRDFIESGWDLRTLLKTIVTSATYQQSSVASAEAKQKDPKNTFLTRGVRYRLDVEQIRDMALSTSGLISKKTGGPSVKPYQPEGHWLISMMSSDTRIYKQSSGEDLYRRSLYTYWKRQATHPVMDIFNVTARETFCVQRDRTNTPLQALTLMNEPLFMESCRQMAINALQSSQEVEVILDDLSQRLLSRVLNEEEKGIVRSSYESIMKTFTESPDDAKKLLEVGETPVPENLSASQVASWTMVASQLFNLDETVTK